MKNGIYVFLAAWWICFGALSGFHFSQWPNVQETILPLLERQWQALVPLINASSLATPKVMSDSTGQYLMFVTTMLFGFVFSIAYSSLKHRRSSPAGKQILLCFAQYYLALFLLIYGVNKAFKWQFADPEPNLLYTQAGLLSKELLFWMSTGSSMLYNLISGLIEICAGILLLFRPRMILTVLLTFAITSHIVLLNFSFDISVKLFSTFLWLLSFTLLYHTPNIGFLIGKNLNTATATSLPLPAKNNYGWIKLLVIIAIGLESFGSLVHLQWNNIPLNGDRQKKPPLHGAYRVVQDESSPVLIGTLTQIDKLFIHKNGYMICMDSESNTDRHSVYIDVRGRMCIDADEPTVTQILDYRQEADTLYLSNATTIVAKLVALPWQKMPLLQDDMRLFMDSD